MSLNIASNPDPVEIIDSTAVAEDAQQQRRRRIVFVRLMTKVFWGVVAVLVVAGFFLYYVYRTTQTEPVFYREVMLQSPAELEAAGDRFESRMLEMQNQLQVNPKWSAVLQEKEINGWLAIDCPTKFPELTPPRLSQPRMQILESEVQLAFRYRASRFSAVVTFVGDVFIADNTGEIAVRIKRANSGIIPIPIAKLADRLTAHLRKSGIDVAWTQIEDDPVALLRVPADMLQFADQTIQIESIVCKDEQLVLVGTSVANDPVEAN